jgi:hypothetical protein
MRAIPARVCMVSSARLVYTFLCYTSHVSCANYMNKQTQIMCVASRPLSLLEGGEPCAYTPMKLQARVLDA